MSEERLDLPQTQLSMEAIQTETSALIGANKATTDLVSPGKAFIVGQSQPDLFNEADSPYGTPVRFIITAGELGHVYQTQGVDGDSSLEPETFAVVDLKDAIGKDIGGKNVRFVGDVRVDDEEATHLLVSKTFGDAESPYAGFIALQPGQTFDIGRNNPEMGKNFGITPGSKSTVSGKHGRIRILTDGSIAMVDFGSTNGSSVTTRNNTVTEASQVASLPTETASAGKEVHAGRKDRVRTAGAAMGRVMRRVVPPPPGELRSDAMGGTYRRVR